MLSVKIQHQARQPVGKSEQFLQVHHWQSAQGRDPIAKMLDRTNAFDENLVWLFISDSLELVDNKPGFQRVWFGFQAFSDTFFHLFDKQVLVDVQWVIFS